MQLSLDVVDANVYRPKKGFQNKFTKEVRLTVTEFTEITSDLGIF